MGGVDLLNSSFKKYFPEICSQKWWWPLHAWNLSVCSVNASSVKVKVTKNQYLDFLRDLYLGMVGVHGQDRILPPLQTVKKFDAKNHWPVHLPEKKTAKLQTLYKRGMSGYQVCMILLPEA